MIGDGTVFLGDGEMYDIIIDVVGEETSLEFCTLLDHYLEENTLDAAMRLNGVSWSDIEPPIDEVEDKASALRDEKRQKKSGPENE